MFDGLGMMMFGGSTRAFDLQLRCFSAPFFERADTKKINELNHGGKILLPPSALDLLVRLNIEYPMMFKIQSIGDPGAFTHCGVLEFLAEEGRCYLPSWMMRQLHLNEGECVRVTYSSLPKATYTKLKPQSTDFLVVSNPRAVLEVELRKFACLTKGDIIAVEYNDQVLEFLVMEVKPGTAVSIIECDMNVEFDAPEGYVEPDANIPSSSNVGVGGFLKLWFLFLQSAVGMVWYETNILVGLGSLFAKMKIWSMVCLSLSSTLTAPMVDAEMAGTTSTFTPFSGAGYRLDGKLKSSSSSLDMENLERSLPQLTVDVNYSPGKLDFIRYKYKCRSLVEKELAKEKEQANKQSNISPFEGTGHVLRSTRR
ncbi:unnamed protein product [Thelazia callipaeda]|uniref:Ubiquitin fusion degradation protein 1 homolog n=1 Tax=Thelazia callipaeda TaxID=103827 RepID=A0A158RB96_THECL|nr:unnamed protein product [Thelazia callipaeda]